MNFNYFKTYFSFFARVGELAQNHKALLEIFRVLNLLKWESFRALPANTNTLLESFRVSILHLLRVLGVGGPTLGLGAAHKWIGHHHLIPSYSTGLL